MPIDAQLATTLSQFKNDNGFVDVGAIGTALILTRKAWRQGLPLDVAALLTPGGGQVSRLNVSIWSPIHELGATRNVIKKLDVTADSKWRMKSAQ